MFLISATMNYIEANLSEVNVNYRENGEKKYTAVTPLQDVVRY